MKEESLQDYEHGPMEQAVENLELEVVLKEHCCSSDIEVDASNSEESCLDKAIETKFSDNEVEYNHSPEANPLSSEDETTSSQSLGKGNVISKDYVTLENIMEEVIESVVENVNTFVDSPTHEGSAANCEIKIDELMFENNAKRPRLEASHENETATDYAVDHEEDNSASPPRRKSSRVRHRCSNCSKTFATTETLKAHQNICANLTSVECEPENESDQDQIEIMNDGAWQPGNESLNISDCENEYKPNLDKTDILNEDIWLEDNDSLGMSEDEDFEADNKNDVKIKTSLFDFMKFVYRCEYSTLGFKCSKKFFNPDDLENHSKLHGKFKCSFCPVKKSYAPNMPIHEYTHRKFHISHGANAKAESKKAFLCPHCSYRTVYKAEFTKHHVKMHMNLVPDTFTCIICKYKWTYHGSIRVRLVNHYKTHHQTSSKNTKRIYKCKYNGCEAYFRDRRQSAYHRFQQHLEEAEFKCKDCDKRFINKEALDSHLEKYHSEKEGFPCTAEGCWRKFMTKKSMMNHRKMCLSGSSSRKSLALRRRHKCYICFKIFATSNLLRVHHIACAKAFPECSAGKMKFSDSEELKQNNLSLDVSNFMKTKHHCSYSTSTFKCLSKFYNPEDLKNHSKLHGKFKCSFCSKTKLYAPSIPIHELTHNKFHSSHGPNAKQKSKKLYLCPHCDFKSLYKGIYIRHHLKVHMNLVSNQNTCPICQVKWIQQSDFLKKFSLHYKSHHQTELDGTKTTHRCEYEGCPAYFLKPKQLASHNLYHYPERSKFKCGTCDKHFTSAIAKRLHFKKYHSTKSIPIQTPNIPCMAPGCGRKFSTKAGMLLHRRCCPRWKVKKEYEPPSSVNVEDLVSNTSDLRRIKHKGPLPYPCGEENCSEQFFTSEELERHSKFHGTFKCMFCEEVKTYAPDLSIHEVEHHTSKGEQKHSFYSCARCNARFRRRGYYINHHLQHLDLPPLSETSCNICNYTFTVDKWLEKNIKLHYEKQHNPEGGYPVRCEEEGCSAYFRFPKQLDFHLGDVHLKSQADKTKRIWYCLDCDYTSRYPFELRKHRRRRHPCKFSWKCEKLNCTETFETEKDLNIHIKRHTQILEICKLCKKSFAKKGALQLHMKAHDEDTSKPVSRKLVKKEKKERRRLLCAICGKEFSIQGYLDLHLLSHSGPESWQFACETCGKKCMTQQKLEEHLNTHRTKDKKVFTCEHCGLTYAHRHNFRHHLKNKHGIILEDGRKKIE